MKTTINAAAAAVLAVMLATVARADDTPQRVEVIGKMAPTRDCRPNYPEAAARAGAQGTTVLAFQVDATGKLTGVDVAHASGPTREHRLLDAAAAVALARCAFVPALNEEGKPVASTVTVNYTWRLE